MLHKAALCSLLGLIAFVAVAADAYQRVIDEVARGYEIFGREDMLQDESALRSFLSADGPEAPCHNQPPCPAAVQHDVRAQK